MALSHQLFLNVFLELKKTQVKYTKQQICLVETYFLCCCVLIDIYTEKKQNKTKQNEEKQLKSHPNLSNLHTEGMLFLRYTARCQYS